MGAFATLHFGMQYCTSAAKSRALSLMLVGCDSGAHPAAHRQFMEESVERARAIRRLGMVQLANTYGYGPTRIQFLSKDPRGFTEHTA